MELTQKNVAKASNPVTCVRFTDEEYSQISRNKEDFGLSIPHLLKRSYFSRGKLQFLMNVNVAKSITIQLRKIGNNLNQIAKIANMKGNVELSGEIKECMGSIKRMEQSLRADYGSS